MTTFSGSFSTTDKDATIRPKKDPIDEVIDILTDPTGGSGPPSARAMRNVSAVSPQVNVQQLGSLPLNNNPAAMANIRDIANQVFDPARPQNFRDQELDMMQGTAPLGIPSIGVNPVSGIGYPEYSPGGGDPYEAMDPDMFDPDTGEYINFLARIGQPQGLGAIDPYEQFGDNLLGGDASTVYGINPIVKRIAEFQDYDMDTDEGVRKYLADTQKTMARNEELEEFSRKDREDRERAAMLAAQQQPVDPCPEGYRLDPVSKVCVPTDDTTEPDNITPRTYDTMTRPEPNYTPATNFNLPAITLPDILTGN